jgi:hypothetical protein
MPQPQFIPSPLKIIERRPRCQNCGARMMMTGIEPMGLGTDRRTFECDQCGREESCLSNSEGGPGGDPNSLAFNIRSVQGDRP